MSSQANEKKPAAAINGASWVNSNAKNLIAQDMIDGYVPMSEKLTEEVVDEIYDQLYKGHEFFKNFPYDSERYKNRMESIQKTLLQWKDSARKDAIALRRDRTIYPAASHNIRGEPHWNRSDAQKLLKQDMDNGIHLQYDAPSKFWETRPEYQQFTKKTFRKHIDQEKQKRKEFGKTPGQAKKMPKHKLGGSQFRRDNPGAV